jgi:hypothetical protein
LTLDYDEPLSNVAFKFNLRRYNSVLREQVVEMTFEGKTYEDVVDTVGAIAFSTYAFASNRVSHMLGLVGASLSIDCASSSALVAVHMAAGEARQGRGKGLRCLAASVNLILHHNLTDLHTARNMFPHDGRCKTFDASADGFERGEGSGAVLMRHASEVLAPPAGAADADAATQRFNTGAVAGRAADDPPEQECIIVLVRGSSTIHKGGGASLRALRGPAIQHKVRAALDDAGMAPSECKYMEASGLGEPYGDAVEVGAYQALFQPGRDPRDKLVFGSIHTNIGHLDGCSGMASFIKTCLVAQHGTAPPIVHFRSLHPLMRGKSAAAEGAAMGHTWNDVDVKAFPAAFPMGRAPMFSVANGGSPDSARPTCAAGVSSFGFGGTMAHVIVDHSGADRSRPPPQPFYYRNEVAVARPALDGRKRAAAVSEESMTYIENIIWTTLRTCLGASRKLTRGGNLFDAGGLALTHAEGRAVEEQLRERLGMPFLPKGIVAGNPSVAKLGEAVLRTAIRDQAGQSLDVAAFIKSWRESQAQRQRIEPERQPSSLLLAPPPRNKRRMIFVLANPRSGSTLTQLMLNANPHLFAPQELYLLHFYTMGERRRRLAGQDLEGWIVEGLRKAVMELRGCEAAAADATLAELDTLDTQQVYDVLQGWAGERILVDKTPPYVWSLDTLRRAEAIFEDARYISLYRHPYANVASMAKETIKREWLSDSLDGMMGTGPSALDAGAPGAPGVAGAAAATGAAGAPGAAGARGAGAVQEAEAPHSTILAAVEEAEAAAGAADAEAACLAPGSPSGGSDDDGSDEHAAPSALAPPVHATAAALAKARASKGRTQNAIDRALWDEAENLWALGNANAMDFLQEVPPERRLSLAFEDLVTLPEASARALCKLVGVQYVADMTNPYTERNMASFAPATEGGLGAGDPHVLQRTGIDPGAADAWRAVAPPRALTPFSAHVAKRLGYRLPMWKEPAARVGTPAAIVRLNAHTAGPVVILVHDTSGEVHALRPLAAALPCAAFGIRATPSYGADGAAAILPDADIPALAARYRAAAAKALGLTAGDGVVYGGAGPLGSRVAFEMAAQQQRATAATTTTAAAAAAAAATAAGSSPAEALTKVLATAGAAGRTWETAAAAGEPAVVGLLLVDGTVSGQPDPPLPVDLYALYAVARDEAGPGADRPDDGSLRHRHAFEPPSLAWNDTQ